MKNIFLIVFMMMTAVFAQVKDTSEANREKFDPSRNPAKDLKAAVQQAEKSGKRILLDVGGEWCIWCHRLDKFLHEDTVIDSILTHNFITVKVNFSPENKNTKFLKKYPQIEGYPHIFVLEKNGKLLHSQNTGLLEEGKYYNKDKVIAFLKEWSHKE